MKKTYHNTLPRSAAFLKEIDRSRSFQPNPATYVPFKERKKGNVIGRFTPPVPPSRGKKKSITLPKLKFLVEEKS